MKIVHAVVTLTRIPVIRAHKMAIGTTLHQENVLLRLSTNDGLEGLGEAPHMVGVSLKGESPATVLEMLRQRLLPAVFGRSPLDVEAIQQAMDAAVPWNLRAKSAVNLAVFDLAGKALGVPVHVLLGGMVRAAVPLSWSIPITDFEAGVREAQEMVARGWRIIKVKLGRPQPDEDVEMVGRIREAVGPGVRLRADANQAYSVKTAIRVARRLERYDVEFFEQPVAWWDLDGMAEVSRATELPIMADESATTVQDALEIARRRAAQILSIYVCSPGGILNSKKVATVAAAAGIAAYVGGALEGPVGAAAGLHFAASTPSVTYGCELGGQFLLQEDVAQTPLVFTDGALQVPTGPGLGVSLDWDRVRRYTIAEYTLRAGEA
ncbi:MAG: enolase C-terminal domain-like protein [Armatimonadota bacterium]|nr:enolase C-terminal domain-like protein [Armatimonadota bacterium]MDR7426356.1 enolase C-terminal domain-like protein [Armatimonadota bacterium]MDR7463346.1 enolase C-terminal domain-like protein [Armatimonadota bacterium]MDR7469160.1 enolase C-terminal domain-like protein [Armatimonadota bacterium]MDR7474569.1 enolase C-terminal domain-like protein [Armatimonadota bacterium]